VNAIDLATRAAALTEYWSQSTVAEANGNLFKVAKGIGATNWHTHHDQDETFLVLNGAITIQLRTGDVHLAAGDLFVIPRGIEHCPHAAEEVHLLLIGPSVTSTPEGGKPAWSYGSGSPASRPPPESG
jgi:mannose-6-phosphate isomerase-like protein (cupin superfamily)